MPPKPVRWTFLIHVVVFCHPCPLYMRPCHFLFPPPNHYSPAVKWYQDNECRKCQSPDSPPTPRRRAERKIYNAKNSGSDELWPWIYAGRISLSLGCDAFGGNKAFKTFRSVTDWRASSTINRFLKSPLMVEGAPCCQSTCKNWRVSPGTCPCLRKRSSRRAEFKIATSTCQNMKVIKEVISSVRCKFSGQGKPLQFLKSSPYSFRAIVIFCE